MAFSSSAESSWKMRGTPKPALVVERNTFQVGADQQVESGREIVYSTRDEISFDRHTFVRCTLELCHHVAQIHHVIFVVHIPIGSSLITCRAAVLSDVDLG